MKFYFTWLLLVCLTQFYCCYLSNYPYQTHQYPYVCMCNANKNHLMQCWMIMLKRFCKCPLNCDWVFCKKYDCLSFRFIFHMNSSWRCAKRKIVGNKIFFGKQGEEQSEIVTLRREKNTCPWIEMIISTSLTLLDVIILLVYMYYTVCISTVMF